MALSYDGSGGLFTKLGTIIRASNLFEEQETTNTANYLYKEMTDLQAKLESDNKYDDRSRLEFYQTWDEFNNILRNWKRDITDLILPVLREALDSDENFHSSDLLTMLNYLVFCMNRDSKTVKQNTVTITGPTAGSPSPSGNFTVVSSKYKPTAQGADSSSQEDGTAWSNSYKVICTNNQNAGAEVFEVRGNLPRNDLAHPEWYHAGVAGVTTVISSDGNTLLSNGGFESNASSGTGFTSWTINTGTWDTDLAEDTSVVYRGNQSLKFVMTGTDQKLTQSLASGTLRPFTKYIISYKVRTSGSPTGTLKVGFTGTTGLYDSVDVSGLSTTFAVRSHVFNTGSDPDSITNFIIEMDTSGGSGNVYIDEVTLSPVDIFHGVGISVIGGSIDPAVGDFWTVVVSNDYAGKFQTFFARWYGILLPGSSSPAIDEALAS